MTFDKAIAKLEKADQERHHELIMHQAVATVVIGALMIWVGILFRSPIIIGLLILLIVVLYAVFIPKRRFR